MQQFRYVFRAMASEHELVLCGSGRAFADEVARRAIADVLRIERKYSRYRDDSVTSAINRAAGGAAVAVDDETASLLRYAGQLHDMSGGRFDLTSGVLRRAWDFSRRPPELPGERQLAAARALIDWRSVEWTGRAVRLPRAGMELDFGGIGKEYAADRAAAICREQGVLHGLVNLGGDVRAVGSRPDGTPWRVGIRHPREPAGVIATALLDDNAVATSGDYARYFELDGRRYCHVLDARTGVPVTHWQSVSVLAPLATLAGSYATIAMLLGPDAEGLMERERVSCLMIAAGGAMRIGASTATGFVGADADGQCGDLPV